MTWRKGHGNGAGVPRIEVLPPDELPAPEPAQPDTLARRSDGTVADSQAAKALGARGGAARARKRLALKGLGLSKLVEADDFHPYWKLSEEWIHEKLADLAQQAGGYLGPGPSAIVVNAGQLHFAGLYIRDLAMKMGGPQCAKLLIESGNLADKSRIFLMTAYELAVREAKARVDSQVTDPYDGLLEAAGADEDNQS